MNRVHFCPGLKNSFPIDIGIHRGFLELHRGEKYLKFSSIVELFFLFSLLILFYYSTSMYYYKYIFFQNNVNGLVVFLHSCQLHVKGLSLLS